MDVTLYNIKGLIFYIKFCRNIKSEDISKIKTVAPIPSYRKNKVLQ